MSQHRVHYQSNFTEGNVKAICSCGWWVEGERSEVVAKGELHCKIYPDPPRPQVVEANFAGEVAVSAAKQIREIADLVETGQVRDLVIVWANKGENKFCTNGFMDDRWRLLGAIEYAKKYVMD